MKKNKLSPEQEKWKQVYLKAGSDPLWFAKTFFPHAFSLPFADFHYDIAEAYMDDELKRVAVLAPRGHGKSELCSFLFPVHASFYHPQVKNGGVIVIISDTEDFSIDRIETIKLELETNPIVNAFYGKMVGSKWQAKQIRIENKDLGINTTIFARGTGQQLRGAKKGHRRPYFVFLDDAEPEDECRNHDLVANNLRWLNMVVGNALATGGRMFYIATLMAEESMTHKIAKSDKWFTLLYSAIKQDGNMLWEAKMGIEEFKDKYELAKESGQLDQFWLEFMNLPYNPQNKELTHAHIMHYEPAFIENKILNNYITIDPAFSSEKTSDYTGIAVVGVDDEMNYFVHKVVYSQAKDPKSIVEELIPLIKEFFPVGVYIESFGAQVSLVSAIGLLMKDYNISTPVLPMRGKYQAGAKATRIRGFISEIKRGKVFFSNDKSVYMAIRDFLAFPDKIGGGHYDVIDAISYTKQIAIAPKVFHAPKRKTDWAYMVEALKKHSGKHKVEEILQEF